MRGITYSMKAAKSILTVFATCAFSTINTDIQAHTLTPDSIGTEVRNGQQLIIHRIKPKETYYGISRNYSIPVNALIEANKNKALKIGETILIPTGRKAAVHNNTEDSNAPAENSIPQLTDEEIGEYTTYKVGKKETLFAISQRFRVSIESIKRANNLTSENLKEGALLKVPHNEIPDPQVVEEVVLVDIVEGSDNIPVVEEIPTNRYGIREISEKGLGVWIDNLNQDSGSMLALHQTAPVGTVIKITNPMTKLTTFVKVVGKFADNAETQNAIIVISKSAAAQMGILDRRFQIEIAYGSPME